MPRFSANCFTMEKSLSETRKVSISSTGNRMSVPFGDNALS